MLMQTFGVTNEEHYGMLWIFWSDQLIEQEGQLIGRITFQRFSFEQQPGMCNR